MGERPAACGQGTTERWEGDKGRRPQGQQPGEAKSRMKRTKLLCPWLRCKSGRGYLGKGTDNEGCHDEEDVDCHSMKS